MTGQGGKGRTKRTAPPQGRQPAIIRREAFLILGLQEHFPPHKEDFEGLWKRFKEHIGKVQPHSTDGAFYGANFAGQSGKGLTCLAGMAVTKVDMVPERLTLRGVPASRYAVFEATVQTIHDTYEWVFHEWLKAAAYPRSGADSPKADFERYPPGTDSGSTPVLLQWHSRDESSQGGPHGQGLLAKRQ